MKTLTKPLPYEVLKLVNGSSHKVLGVFPSYIWIFTLTVLNTHKGWTYSSWLGQLWMYKLGLDKVAARIQNSTTAVYLIQNWQQTDPRHWKYLTRSTKIISTGNMILCDAITWFSVLFYEFTSPWKFATHISFHFLINKPDVYYLLNRELRNNIHLLISDFIL